MRIENRLGNGLIPFFSYVKNNNLWFRIIFKKHSIYLEIFKFLFERENIPFLTKLRINLLNKMEKNKIKENVLE